jgi:predicted HTH domain antitoxin
MLKLEIPEDILISLKIPKKDLEKELKRELALALYQKGTTSLGKARKLAKMSKWEFIEELGKRKIPRHYSEEELKEDLDFVKGSK